MPDLQPRVPTAPTRRTTARHQTHRATLLPYVATTSSSSPPRSAAAGSRRSKPHPLGVTAPAAAAPIGGPSTPRLPARRVGTAPHRPRPPPLRPDTSEQIDTGVPQAPHGEDAAASLVAAPALSAGETADPGAPIHTDRPCRCDASGGVDSGQQQQPPRGESCTTEPSYIVRGPASSTATATKPLLLPSPRDVDGNLTDPQLLVAQLDALRRTSVENGQLLHAQQCLDEMRKVAAQHGSRVRAHLTSSKTLAIPRQRLHERHRAQQLTFSSLWETKLHDFDLQAEHALRDLRARRQREYEDLEDVIRGALVEQRPHFSSQVVGTQRELDRLIRHGRYSDAHKLRQELSRLMEAEEQRFEELTALRFSQQTRVVKRRFAAEVTALKMRLETDRAQLVGQRRNDHETLQQRQVNEIINFEQRMRTERAKALRDVDRRIKAMEGGSVAKGFDLAGLSRVAESAYADVVPAGEGGSGGRPTMIAECAAVDA